jgi:hypothetical protein
MSRVRRRARRPDAGCWLLFGLVAAALLGGARAHAQSCRTTSEGGYEVTRCQSTTNPPADSVGWKKTDRQTRLGNTPATQGSSVTFELVIGTFAKKCPTATGKVAGTFEFSTTKDEIHTDGGETRRTHFSNRLIATLEGQVGDDAKLRYVEIEGTATRERDGAQTERRAVPRQRFTPGTGGEPDWEAMFRSVEATGDLSVASAMLFAGETYKLAELEWNRPNECVKFEFDPPTDTRVLAPNESVQVRMTLRAKDGGVVGGATLTANNFERGGTVTPHDTRSQPDSPVQFNYTAPATVHRPSGFDVAALNSQAGVGHDKWRILDRGRYEGTFTYTDSVAMGIVNDAVKVTGNLVWTSEDRAPPSSPTFGDVASAFFRPSEGEITVAVQFDNRGIGGPGACKGDARRTFPIASLTRDALRYMLLEIAEDGRYKLTLVIPDTPDPFPTWEFEAVCVSPMARATLRQKVHHVSMVLGLQQGKLDAEQGVVGRLGAPIRRGPREVHGSWSFKKARQQ